jgi:hypothetical protein
MTIPHTNALDLVLTRVWYALALRLSFGIKQGITNKATMAAARPS